MGRADFVAAFGGVFEHSPWIAERAFDGELGAANDTAEGLHFALCKIFRTASETERLGVLTAHPDLAGKLAAAKQLTAESTAEQASAGLDALTDAEKATFTQLNNAYVAKFSFPFIIAVKGRTKAEIVDAFKTRINNGGRRSSRPHAARSSGLRFCACAPFCRDHRCKQSVLNR